ncbi:hypothetical protein C7405_102183 [Paraburkholderia caballeronis]|nr:hypothetical protein C7405_102183 [Paraburkholderia caballeronis]
MPSSMQQMLLPWEEYRSPLITLPGQKEAPAPG